MALRLLFYRDVSKIYLNDADPVIWSLWHSILHRTDSLIKLVEETNICVDEWDNQREILNAENVNDTLLKGFAALYLNRTSRSGIIKGSGVIGGREQKGSYKIDCRFNRKSIIQKIKRISKYKEKIRLSNIDASDFLLSIGANLPQHSIIYSDPPYFEKGRELYSNYFDSDDHIAFAEIMKNHDGKWLVTYDQNPNIEFLYQNCKGYTFDISYSLQVKRRGNEILVLGEDLDLINSEVCNEFGIRQISGV